jgi:hypothetical protein
MDKENLEIIDKHLEMAEQIVLEESRKTENKEQLKKLKDIEFSLEKAECNVEELEEECK